MVDKLILFDWGNIVSSHEVGYTVYDAWNELFKECGYVGTDDVYYNLVPKYDLERTNNLEEYKEQFVKFKEVFGLNVEFDEYIEKQRKIFNKIYYYKETRDYEVSLKDRVHIGILSNLSMLDKWRLDRDVGLSNYEYVFLSFEMGLLKPDIRIFEEVQKQLPFEKENILFVDDNISNIDVAKEFGWNVCHATGLELDKIKEACESFIGDC